MTGPAARWREILRGQLLTARKQRCETRTAALRSALSAIDNAETPDVDPPRAGAIATSAQGLGAAEIPRRTLSEYEIRALLQAEVDERDAAAEALIHAGRRDRAEQLRSEAAVLTELLRRDVGPS